MAVFVANKTAFKIQSRLLEKAFRSTLEAVKKKIRRDVSVVIVSDKEIREINRLYRGKDEVTDVLSFSFLRAGGYFQKEKAVIGEIFISAETACKQAKEAGHSFEKEITLLFVHSFLHILGYKHDTKEEISKMKRLEKKILLKIF